MRYVVFGLGGGKGHLRAIRNKRESSWIERFTKDQTDVPEIPNPNNQGGFQIH